MLVQSHPLKKKVQCRSETWEGWRGLIEIENGGRERVCPRIGCRLPLTVKCWGRSQLRSSDSRTAEAEVGLRRSGQSLVWTLRLCENPPFALPATTAPSTLICSSYAWVMPHWPAGAEELRLILSPLRKDRLQQFFFLEGGGELGYREEFWPGSQFVEVSYDGLSSLCCCFVPKASFCAQVAQRARSICSHL